MRAAAHTLHEGARHVAISDDKWPITGRNGTNGRRRPSPEQLARKIMDVFVSSRIPAQSGPGRARLSDAGSALYCSAFITRMNPDLAMDTADQKLLKSTGAGNLFMVFGEPDLELRALPDGKPQVELHGLDVYDPTTGEIRSSSTDDIACWFIDSDDNEESFFVRQLHRRRRALQEAPARPQGRDRRGRLGDPLQHREPPVRRAVDRQDRGEGDQPLWG